MMELSNFNEIVLEVKNCDKCKRMINKEGVLGTQCGSINIEILFIGEAPGRLGAEISKVPFSGDQTGKNFEELIKSINWSREKFFITNAVLCNPLKNNGDNDSPKDLEIKECSIYLKQIIELIKPKLIVTLGGNALKGLNYIHKHNIKLKENVAQPFNWNGYTVFPLYHCSPKAINIWRSKELQLEDFRKLRDYVKEW